MGAISSSLAAVAAAEDDDEAADKSSSSARSSFCAAPSLGRGVVPLANLLPATSTHVPCNGRAHETRNRREQATHLVGGIVEVHAKLVAWFACARDRALVAIGGWRAALILANDRLEAEAADCSVGARLKSSRSIDRLSIGRRRLLTSTESMKTIVVRSWQREAMLRKPSGHAATHCDSWMRRPSVHAQ